MIPATYDVRIWRIEKSEGKTGTSYKVRWGSRRAASQADVSHGVAGRQLPFRLAVVVP
jgi:hypothetical protein